MLRSEPDLIQLFEIFYFYISYKRTKVLDEFNTDFSSDSKVIVQSRSFLLHDFNYCYLPVL